MAVNSCFFMELICFKNVNDGNGANLKFGLNRHNWTNYRDENSSQLKKQQTSNQTLTLNYKQSLQSTSFTFIKTKTKQKNYKEILIDRNDTRPP
ncbi:hypothetical protein Hanom_Chr03g00215971 [Helianthus anomalus]